jgi:hypothetical protein
MANTKISQLTTWTGDTTGFYVVVDNSGLTQTYKTTRETLLGSWVSAGTVSNVGWSATTTSPTMGTVVRSAVYYKSIGNKEWEVQMVFEQSGGGSTGTGDYIFTLPNNLSFNTTLPTQQLYTAGVDVNSWSNGQDIIPASGLITNLTEGAQVYPVPWTARTFRVFTTTYLTTNLRFWGGGFYGTGGIINMKFSFTST